MLRALPDYSHDLKVLSDGCLLIKKRHSFVVEKSGRYHISQEIKLVIGTKFSLTSVS